MRALPSSFSKSFLKLLEFSQCERAMTVLSVYVVIIQHPQGYVKLTQASVLQPIVCRFPLFTDHAIRH
jgi:hypothetical protein